MTVTDASPVYFDPFDQDIKLNPYPVYRRLRDEAPLSKNESRSPAANRGRKPRFLFSNSY